MRALFALPLTGLVVTATALGTNQKPQKINPPQAPQIPHTTPVFGDDLPDPYHWMLTYPGQPHSPAVIDYLNKENAYAESHFKTLGTFRQKIGREIKAKLTSAVPSAPEQIGNFLYYRKQESQQQYFDVYRRHVAGGPEEKVIDANTEAKSYSFYELSDYTISPDGNLLAWLVHLSGQPNIARIKNLKTGQIESLAVNPDPFNNIAWSADSEFIYYSTYDDIHRPSKVFIHKIGTPPTSDVLAFEEKDKEFMIEKVTNTKDGKYVLITTRREDLTTEVLYKKSDSNGQPFMSFGPRTHAQSYSVEHQGSDFFILSNHDSVDQGLYKAPDVSPSREHWITMIPPNKDRPLNDFVSFNGYLVLAARVDGLPELEVFNLSTGIISTIDFKEPLYELEITPYGPQMNLSFNRSSIYLNYHSLAVTDRTYEYDFKTGQSRIVHENPKQNLDPKTFLTKRVWVTSRDGVQIPIALVHKKDVKFDGSAPMLLTAHGMYGYSYMLTQPTMYSVASMAPLLDRGWIVAIPSVRGGGEFGPAWAEAGRLQNKTNTFNDFIDAAEFLEKNHYTSPDKMAIRGLSAGGLLLGYVVNNRPDLFKAAVFRSPFVDLMNTMLDTKIPLTTEEWTQWGNPYTELDFKNMRSYSPYDNIKLQKYPSMLVRAAFNDTQVLIHEPAKWTAKLRAMDKIGKDLLFKIDMKGGHAGDSGSDGVAEDESYDMTWLLHQVGMDR